MLLLLSTTVLDDMLKLRSAISLPFGGDIGNLFAGTIMALACLAAAYFIPLKRFYYYALGAFAAGVISFFFLPVQILVFFCAAGDPGSRDPALWSNSRVLIR